MKALVYRDGQIRLEEASRPVLREGEALLRVKAAAICGTDLRIISHGHHLIPPGQPRILGHEVAGVIEESTPEAAHLAPGTPVAVAPNIHCGRCAQCLDGQTLLCLDYQALGIGLDGGFAELMRLPAQAVRQGNVIPLKTGADLGQAALNEPLSCCFNSLQYTELSLGESILIVGAGPIGVMHLLLAQKMGAALTMVSEISDRRLAEVERFGPDLTINPARENLKRKVLEATGGRGTDVAIVACPVAEAHNQALECLAPRGRLNFFGGLPQDRPLTTIDANRVHYNHLKIVGTTRQSLTQYRKTLKLVASGKLDLSGLITGRFSLEEAQEAFETARSGRGLKNIFEL